MTKVDIKVERRERADNDQMTTYWVSFLVGSDPSLSLMVIVNKETLEDAAHGLVAAAIRARSLDGKLTSRELMLETLYPAARRRIRQICR